MCKKIVYAITPARLPASRALRWSYYLAKGLKKAGIDTKLLLLADGRDVKSFDGIKIDAVQMRRGMDRNIEEIVFSLKLLPKIFRNRHEIGLIHAYGVFPNFTCTLIAKLLGIPCVGFGTDVVEELYRHGGHPYPWLGSAIMEFIGNTYVRLADIVITDSATGRRWLATEKGVRASKVATIPHGVDPKFFHPRPKSRRIMKKYGLAGKLVLMFHGDIGYNDGIDVLFDSMKYLGKLKDRIRIVLVGGGCVVERLKERAPDNAVFTGWVGYDKIPEYLSTADIYVIPWRRTKDAEITIPGKMLEAFGMGLPIITSRLEAVRSQFRDNRDVVFFEPEDPKDLAEKLAKLVKNKAMRKRISRRAVELGRKFSWENMINQEIRFLKSRGLLKQFDVRR